METILTKGSMPSFGSASMMLVQNSRGLKVISAMQA
jgi:hypothetical protein